MYTASGSDMLDCHYPQRKIKEMKGLNPMNQNQYTPYEFQGTSYGRDQYYPPQPDESARWLKKIYHELKRANHLSELSYYVRLAEIARERGGALGIDCTAMLRGLTPQKRKRKQCNRSIFDGLEGLL